MKAYTLAASVLLLWLTSAAPLEGQDLGAVRETEDGIKLNFQQAPLPIVLTALAELAGINLLYSDLPKAAVTLRTSTPASQADLRSYLYGVADANGLELVEDGSLLRIVRQVPAASPEEAQDTAQQPTRRLFVYRLDHAQAGQIARTLNALFAESVIAGGTTELSRRGLSAELRDQRLPDRLPAPRTDNARMEGGVTSRQQGLVVMLQDHVRIVPDEPTNSLLIHATETDFATITAAIEELDIRPLQVLIEVLIAEVRRDKSSAFGVSAKLEIPEDPADGVHVGAQLAGLSAGDLAVKILSVGDINAEVILRALAASSEVTILSRPVVLAQNNEEARILVGSQRPFIQISRSLPTDNAVRDQVVQYRDVGTQLTIKPSINTDGYVSLTVLQEISTATAEIQFGAPVISTREVRTRLLVKDGHTAVLGGLVEHGYDYSKSGIPLLKDIPVLGALFGSTQRRKVETELFLFLTPHVIRDDAELGALTDSVRQHTEYLNEALPERLPLFSPDSVGLQPDAAPTER